MKTTLDQWEILHAVVNLGGFGPAAEQLNRSQSTISYAIARMQEQLGVQLFEQRGRKAHLTEMGRLLLAQAESHLSGFHQIEELACSLASGGQSEILLSVDSIFPTERLFAALGEFSRRFPHVLQKVRQSTFLSAESELSAHNADICIVGLPSRECFAQPILDVQVVAVARPDHPLLSLNRPVARVDMIQHTLVVIEGSGSAKAKRQPGTAGQRTLPVNSIEAAIDAVRSGICFGWLPRYRILTQLDSGELQLLSMHSGQSREVRLNLVCKDLATSSPEVCVLAGLLGLHRPVDLI